MRRRAWSTRKSFDNSILCTNESTLIAEVSDRRRADRRAGAATAAMCSTPRRPTGSARRATRTGRINTALAGKSAAALAEAAGIRVPAGTRVLIAPFELIVPEEPLARGEAVPAARDGSGAGRPARDRRRAGAAADRRSRALGGDPLAAPRRRSLAYGAAVRVLRISVNAPGSTGSAGLDTNLAPTMTIGTGFFGRSLADREPAAPRTSSSGPSSPTRATRASRSATSRGLEPWTAAPPAHRRRPTRRPRPPTR